MVRALRTYRSLFVELFCSCRSIDIRSCCCCMWLSLKAAWVYPADLSFIAFAVELRIEVFASVDTFIHYIYYTMGLCECIISDTCHLPAYFYIRLVGLYYKLIVLHLFGYDSLRKSTDDSQLVAELNILRLEI